MVFVTVRGVFEFAAWLTHLPLLAGALTTIPILWLGPVFLTATELRDHPRPTGVWRFPIEMGALFALFQPRTSVSRTMPELRSGHCCGAQC